MNQFKQQIQRDLDDCLAMFVDGELDRSDQLLLLDYLEEHPAHWRRCALAFVDDQFIQNTFSKAVPTAEPPHPAGLKPTAKSVEPAAGKLPASGPASVPASVPARWLAMAVCLSLCAGFLASQAWNRGTDRAASTAPISQPIVATTMPTLMPNITTAWSGLLNTMIEIENTDERAIYYVDHPIPGFLIEAMVFAGHEIDVSQESSQITGPNGQLSQVVFNKIEIRKYMNQRL